MNNKLSKALWGLLIITLCLSFSGILLRTANESKNTTVLTACDYQMFEKSAVAANRSMNEVLMDLKESGVTTISVRETTLRDLESAGLVDVQTYGDFAGFIQAYQPKVWSLVEQLNEGQSISPSNLVVAASDPEVDDFLSSRLKARFTSSELLHFTSDNTSYYVINHELDRLDKSKDAIRQWDTQLGFDPQILDSLKNQGFAIILRPGSNLGSNLAYLDEYEPLIRDYQVATIIYGNTAITGYPDRLNWMKELVNKYDLTIGMIENPSQIGNLSQAGLDKLIYETGYPVNRVYSSSYDEFVKTTDERYYRWVRGVIDRGIRILYVVPFKDTRLLSSENLDNTVDVIADFHATIQDKGFQTAGTLPPMSDSIPGPLHRLMVSLSLLSAALLYLHYLIEPGKRWLLILLALGVVFCAAVNLLIPMDLSKLYALAAAILYPTLSGLLLLIYLREHHEKPLWMQMLSSLLIVVAVNAIGMYTVVTSLADIRYIMNLKTFSGVKIAFLLPLLLFFLNYFFCFNERGKRLEALHDFARRRPTYLVLALLFFAMAVLYIYVGRSGNNSGIEVSSLEIRMREILEQIFIARPRFKELVIGYPALLAMIYLYKRYKQNILLLILGLGVMMGSISMVNSFCHVFTSVSISVNRTAAGLLTGCILAIVVLIGIRILEWFYDLWRRSL